jgi:hypothetical protein
MQTGRYTSADTHNGAPAQPVAFNGIEREVLSALAAIDFVQPVAFMRKHGPEKIRRAIALCNARTGISNPRGFIYQLVTTPGTLPEVKAPADKFMQGKYADIMCRTQSDIDRIMELRRQAKAL